MIELLLIAIIIILAFKLLFKNNRIQFDTLNIKNIQLTFINEEYHLIELKFNKMFNRNKKKIEPEPNKQNCIIIEFNNIDSTIQIDNFNYLLNIINVLSKSNQIDKLIIKITSPGGSIIDFAELYSVLKSIKSNNVEIIASIDKICTSSGYLIASLADEIYATELSTVGSIGVMIEHFNIGDLIKNLGVGYLQIKSGQMKNPLIPYENPSIESINFVQEQVNKNFNIFYKMIESNRKEKLRNIKLIKTGTIFNGIEALENGMIDNIGCTYDLINKYLPSHNIYKLNFNETTSLKSNIFLRYLKMFIKN